MFHCFIRIPWNSISVMRPPSASPNNPIKIPFIKYSFLSDFILRCYTTQHVYIVTVRLWNRQSYRIYWIITGSYEAWAACACTYVLCTVKLTVLHRHYIQCCTHNAQSRIYINYTKSIQHIVSVTIPSICPFVVVFCAVVCKSILLALSEGVYDSQSLLWVQDLLHSVLILVCIRRHRSLI